MKKQKIKQFEASSYDIELFKPQNDWRRRVVCKWLLGEIIWRIAIET